MDNSYSPELASIPLKFLSGDFNQNYLDQNAVKGFAGALRNREMTDSITGARNAVKQNDSQDRENQAYTITKQDLESKLAQAEAELKQLEERERMLLIMSPDTFPNYPQKEVPTYTPWTLGANNA